MKDGQPCHCHLLHHPACLRELLLPHQDRLRAHRLDKDHLRHLHLTPSNPTTWWSRVGGSSRFRFSIAEKTLLHDSILVLLQVTVRATLKQTKNLTFILKHCEILRLLSERNNGSESETIPRTIKLKTRNGDDLNPANLMPLRFATTSSKQQRQLSTKARLYLFEFLFLWMAWRTEMKCR